MPRTPLSKELIPLLTRVLADVTAVRDDVQGMHRIVLSRSIDDVTAALELCHARIVPPAAAPTPDDSAAARQAEPSTRARTDGSATPSTRRRRTPKAES